MEKVILTIEKMDNSGRGIAYYKNKIVFIPFALPKDEVEIKITKETKKIYEGKLLKVVKPSPLRIEARCPYFGKCGGCDLQNLNYDETLKYKKQKVKDIFSKFGNLDINPVIIESKKDFNYRNKITLKVRNGLVGFYAKESNDVIEIDKCLIADDVTNNFIPNIKKFNIKNGEIVLKTNQDKLLVSIKTKDEVNLDNIDFNNIEGIVLNGKTVYGNNYILKKINGLNFEVSYNSFFQVNDYINEKLIDIIKKHLSEKEVVLDLYCGVGSIALRVASVVNKVYGIEIIENAVINAKKNALINKIKNSEFYSGDVSKEILKIDSSIATTIIDPPREGVDKKVLKNINSQKIIYVSCNPVTLVRDIKLLSDRYKLKDVYALDMFPYTEHIEMITVLEKE